MAKKYRFRATNTRTLFSPHRKWIANMEHGKGIQFASSPSLYGPKEAFRLWERIIRHRPECEWVMEAVDG